MGNQKEIKGKYTSAKIFTTKENPIEEYALAQLQMLCDNETLQGCKVRIMPDVHPGKVGTIGLTMTVGEKILPNLVGVDIGCGMTIAKLKHKKMELQKLDAVIRERIPSGFAHRKTPHHFMDEIDLSKLYCASSIYMKSVELSLGTLGSGNHFIEVDKDEEGNLYVVIHSGSRFLGKEVTEYYLNAGQKALKEQEINIPYELTYLEGDLKGQYLHDMQIVQEFASLNREAMLYELIKGMKLKTEDIYSCIHNYIEENENGCLLRKGAISAKENEPVIIPINMKDGIILGYGKGNEDWNCSAPHGAGRILRRDEVKNHFTVNQYKKEMKGIYSSCIGKETLDEAPFAYRSLNQIAEAIEETVVIDKIIKPIYNFKAGK